MSLLFQRLVVCLEESLYIHNIRDMRVLHTIRDTPPNLSGLCTLSICSDNCYLAYPGSNTIGEVQIFDAIHLVRISLAPVELMESMIFARRESVSNDHACFSFLYLASQDDDTSARQSIGSARFQLYRHQSCDGLWKGHCDQSIRRKTKFYTRYLTYVPVAHP